MCICAPPGRAAHAYVAATTQTPLGCGDRLGKTDITGTVAREAKRPDMGFLESAGEVPDRRSPSLSKRGTYFEYEGEVAIASAKRQKYPDGKSTHSMGVTCFTTGASRRWRCGSSVSTICKEFRRRGLHGPCITLAKPTSDVDVEPASTVAPELQTIE